MLNPSENKVLLDTWIEIGITDLMIIIFMVVRDERLEKVMEQHKAPNLGWCNYIPPWLFSDGVTKNSCIGCYTQKSDALINAVTMATNDQILATPSKIDSDPPYYPSAKLYTLCRSVTLWPQNGVKQPDYGL